LALGAKPDGRTNPTSSAAATVIETVDLLTQVVAGKAIAATTKTADTRQQVYAQQISTR
jgi:hypothetical protein